MSDKIVILPDILGHVLYDKLILMNITRLYVCSSVVPFHFHVILECA